ncbi:MAG TPA: DUF2288 domain-containing protein [Gammaproteobacteria bacterium]
MTELRHRLNAETARIAWAELAPHFARGVVVRVGGSLDLVEVAAAFVEDRRDAVDAWLRAGEIRRATDDDAREWQDGDAGCWAVVVAPWVLVQTVGSRQ